MEEYNTTYEAILAVFDIKEHVTLATEMQSAKSRL